MHKKIRKTLFFSIIVVGIMFGFSFAMAPLYNVFCKAIALNDPLRVIDPDLKREVTVQFVTTNNQNLPWEFYPRTASINIHPEENNKVIFFAKNKTNRTMTVQAIPSYAPRGAVQYFHKTECFCFTQQTLKPGQSIEMPVVFRVDKDIPTSINTITLAYTLFDITPNKKRTHA